MLYLDISKEQYCVGSIEIKSAYLERITKIIILFRIIILIFLKIKNYKCILISTLRLMIAYGLGRNIALL